MRAWGLGPLGVRLAAAFVVVAVGALTVFAVSTLVAERADLGRLAAAQRAETTTAIVSALHSAYRANKGWEGADFQPAVTLAKLSGAAVEVDVTGSGQLLRTGPSELLGSADAARLDRPVLVDGGAVGEVRLAFPAGGLSPAERRLRSALQEAAGWSAGLAVLGALIASVAVTRQLVRPLRRLSAAARSVGAGNRGARVGPAVGPGELGEVGAAFDAMAASLEHHEHLRQAMVADVAHELRTPLAILQAETEALVDGVRAPDPAALASLHDEARRLGRMVEDLQTLSSADAAGLSLERKDVDLADVAAGAANALVARFSSEGVSLERCLSPVMVRADAPRLHQVVVNLLANAVKFTPAGGQVRLSVRSDGTMARLEVTDTGPGIPPGERDWIFERFFRGEAGRRSGGTGIGLAVVSQLVEAHHGEVRLESPSGGGATFVITLPSSGDPEKPTDRAFFHH